MSVPAAGNFENSHLLEIELKANEHFGGTLRAADYTPRTATAQKVLATQNANFTILQDPDKDREGKIIWANQCANTLSSEGNDCSMDGTEGNSSSEFFTLDTIKKATLKVKRKLFRTQYLDQADVIIPGYAKMLRELDEYWNGAVVASFGTLDGVNLLTSPYTVNVAGYTTIPPSAWNASLMGYFVKASIKNKIDGANLFTGDNLFLNAWNAAMDSGNGEGKGAAAKFGALDTTFDLFGFAAASVDSYSYLVHPEALALVTKSYYASFTAENPLVVQSTAGTVKYWSVDSPTLPGVKYDVHYTVLCSGNEYYDVWNIYTKGDVLANPTSCTAGRTGILEFRCA